MKKTDYQKRLEGKRNKWKGHLEAWEQSGLTQSEYCHVHGLVAHQFTYWKNHFKKKPDKNLLVPVQISPSSFQAKAAASSALRLNIENGFQIEVERDFDPVFLTRLIRTVKQI